MERRCEAAPATVWDLVVNPQVPARFQSKAVVRGITGVPGTVGFRYEMVARRGSRVDRVEVVEVDAPRVLREQVTSDLLARSAPGAVVHPSQQLTLLVPDGSGTVLRWQLTLPAPLWAGPWIRWASRRAVRPLLDGIAAEAARRSG